jgi:hypothetical protein
MVGMLLGMFGYLLGARLLGATCPRPWFVVGFVAKPVALG